MVPCFGYHGQVDESALEEDYDPDKWDKQMQVRHFHQKRCPPPPCLSRG